MNIIANEIIESGLHIKNPNAFANLASSLSFIIKKLTANKIPMKIGIDIMEM